MSFRGRGGGGGRGFGGGGRGRGGFGGGRGGRGGGGGGGGYRYQDAGPPETVIPLGHYGWTVQEDLVCKVDIKDVPYFNAPIYLENKEQIGKIDEIFGNLRDYFVSVKLGENIKAKSFKDGQQFYIDPAKLLPLERFIPQPGAKQARGRGGRGGRGGVEASEGRVAEGAWPAEEAASEEATAEDTCDKDTAECFHGALTICENIAVLTFILFSYKV